MRVESAVLTLNQPQDCKHVLRVTDVRELHWISALFLLQPKGWSGAG